MTILLNLATVDPNDRTAAVGKHSLQRYRFRAQGMIRRAARRTRTMRASGSLSRAEYLARRDGGRLRHRQRADPAERSCGFLSHSF